MFETRLGILVQTLIWETSKHGQRGAILLGGRELVRGLRGTRTFHLFHLFCKFPWIFAWFGFVGVALLVCLFLLAFAFGEICFLSSLIPVVDRQCLALVRQCREKKIPIPWKQNQEAYQLRYVFGYAMDGSDFRATSSGRPGQMNNPSGA